MTQLPPSDEDAGAGRPLLGWEGEVKGSSAWDTADALRPVFLPSLFFPLFLLVGAWFPEHPGFPSTLARPGFLKD